MLLIEFEACGDCYRWAFKHHLLFKAEGKDPVLKHGKVLDRWGDTSVGQGNHYDHAWLEVEGLAMDWQTMENPARGGKYAGKGWPIDEFYEYHEPQDIQSYTGMEPAELRSITKHTGPWSIKY